AMANAVELEILPDLNFLLAPILAIAKIATMVGLLFTVLSMIYTFGKLGGPEGGSPTERSKDIGLALFGTAFGLITPIPLAFSAVLFSAWVARLEVRMKAAAQRLLLLVQAVSSRPPPPPPRPVPPPADRPGLRRRGRRRRKPGG